MRTSTLKQGLQRVGRLGIDLRPALIGIALRVAGGNHNDFNGEFHLPVNGPAFGVNIAFTFSCSNDAFMDAFRQEELAAEPPLAILYMSKTLECKAKCYAVFQSLL
jgi:hypothetical protein